MPAVTPTAEPTLYDIHQLVKANVPKRKSLIDDRLKKEDLMLFVAPSKSGKTVFAENMCVCLAAGKPFLNMKMNKAKVLYCDAECHLDTAQTRLKRIMEYYKFTEADIPAGQFQYINLRKHQKTIKEVEQMFCNMYPNKDLGLLVIDAMYRFYPKTGKFSENDNAQMTEYMLDLLRLADTLGCAVLLIHHTPKGGSKNNDRSVFDAASGAGATGRFCDNGLTLYSHQVENCYTFKGGYRDEDGKAQDVVIRFEFPTFIVDPELDPKDVLKSGKQQVSKEEYLTDGGGSKQPTGCIQTKPEDEKADYLFISRFVVEKQPLTKELLFNKWVAINAKLGRKEKPTMAGLARLLQMGVSLGEVKFTKVGDLKPLPEILQSNHGNTPTYYNPESNAQNYAEAIKACQH